MTSTRRLLRPIFSSVVGLMVWACALGPQVASAYQADGPFAEEQAKHAAEWQRQDAEIDQKLKALQKRFGKRPNIVYILGDDIGWGELGSYGGGKARGTPTPNLDRIAAQGMKFLSHYAEPICTPTRAALMTGRIPVRTGLDQVLWPGQTKGLLAGEYSLAELLSDAGYYTAMLGKWHLGELSESQPTNQGFDYAFYTQYNGGVWPWSENAKYFDPENVTVGEVPYQLDIPKDYSAEFGIPLKGILESRKGETPRQVGELTLERYNIHDDELTEKALKFIEANAKSDKPFFLYFASNAQQVFACPPEYRNKPFVDHSNCQAAQLAQHDQNVKRIVDKLAELKIAENTLVVWMSDNGPMYNFFPSAGYSWLRGGKGSAYEGGVRTPAFAVWPGMIAPGQDPMEMIHITDWYTTAAHLAGALERIPNDRVTDGIDQTAYLLLGDGASRRHYLFYYEASSFQEMTLAAVRYKDVKFFIKKGGLGEIYNVVRDPAEKINRPGAYLWVPVPFMRMVAQHLQLMQKYPNHPQVDSTERMAGGSSPDSRAALAVAVQNQAGNDPSNQIIIEP